MLFLKNVLSIIISKMKLMSFKHFYKHLNIFMNINIKE